MTAKKYIALRDGYVDGKVIAEGESFVTDFSEIVRDESGTPIQHEKKEFGQVVRPAVYPIKRDKDGNAVRGKDKVPSWARPANDVEYAAAQASDNAVTDVDLTQVGLPGLKAMAAERHIDPKGLSEDALITAIKAWNDPTR